MGELIPLFQSAITALGVAEDQVRSFSREYLKDGTKAIRLHLFNGQTLLWEETPEGIRSQHLYELPSWTTPEERDRVVKRLYSKGRLTQTEIAQAIGCSQKTVSNILRRMGVRTR